MAPEFTKTQIALKGSLGEVLCKKREDLKHSVKEVELGTRIRAKYIQALENDDFDKLPSDIYVRGFLKNYCEYLGLDYQDALALYRRGREFSPKEPKVESRKRPVPKSPSFVLTPKVLILAGVFVGTAFIIGFMAWQFSLFAASPELKVVSPPNNSTVEGDTVVLEGQANPGANLFVNDIAIQNSNGAFKEKISLQNGPNLIKVVAINSLSKKTEAMITVVAKFPESKIDPISVAFKGVQIKLTAGDYPVTLDLTMDGKDKVHQFLMPGTSQTFKANEKISLNTSNAKSTKVELSNEKMLAKDLGFLLPPDKKVSGNAPVPKPTPKIVDFTKDSVFN